MSEYTPAVAIGKQPDIAKPPTSTHFQHDQNKPPIPDALLRQQFDEMETSIDATGAKEELPATFETMRAEPIDQTWAPSVESEIRNYLSAHLGDGYSIQSVECHQDLCAIEAADLDTDRSSSRNFFSATISAMATERWWTEFDLDGFTLAGHRNSSHQFLYIVFVERK